MDMTDMKRRFNEEIHKLKLTKGKNTQLFSRDEYYSFLTKVQVSKDKIASKTPEEYQRLSRYDIVKFGTVQKLIVPVKNDREPIKYYCYLEETYDIIHETHISIGHGGRNRMMKELKPKYKNITKEFVALYLSLCEPCQKKLSVPKKELVVKPIKSSEFNFRCQVDLIDMQTQADNDFKFIMIYQDYLTKFVILRSLKTKRAQEVAYHLLDIFTIFGAPCILHSDNGREFVNKVIIELCQMWEEFKIVHGKPRHSQSQGSVERANQDIEKMVFTWLETNDTTKWSEGLRFVQFMKNRAYHSGIDRSPYEAMFGCKPKVGLKSVLPSFDGLTKIVSEDDLEAMLKDGESGEGQNVIVDRADDALNEDSDNTDEISAAVGASISVTIEPESSGSGDCNSKRRKYKKSNILCNSKCHKSSSCQNK